MLTAITIISVVIIVAVILIVFIIRSRNELPEHLRPYFKNYKELEESTIAHRAEMDKRRQELTDPKNAAEAAEYLSLNSFDTGTQTYHRSIAMVEACLQDDPAEYGQLLGELYMTSKIHRDPQKAYYYYFIGLSQNGYSVGFMDRNLEPPYYCGPVGDFRNESQVSDLVVELGWDCIKQLDIKAMDWLKKHKFEAREIIEEYQENI